MDKIEELREYAKIEGSELGEALELLCEIDNLKDYLSSAFGKAIEKEINYELNFMKNNTKIVVREYTQTNEYKELVWLEEDD